MWVWRAVSGTARDYHRQQRCCVMASRGVLLLCLCRESRRSASRDPARRRRCELAFGCVWGDCVCVAFVALVVRLDRAGVFFEDPCFFLCVLCCGAARRGTRAVRWPSSHSQSTRQTTSLLCWCHRCAVLLFLLLLLVLVLLLQLACV